MNFGDRAYVPAGAMGILTARTLTNSHPVLARLLEPALSVLDVGCGPGTLTAEIARRVEPGHVVGMDVNPDMIAAAEAAYPPGAFANLVFYRGDVRESGWDAEFDLVNAARVLQWIPDPDRAVECIARAAAPGGHVVLLDYDHTRAEWSDPPSAWSRFYAAFLAWRKDGGLDNAIAERLAALGERVGLRDIAVHPLPSTVRAADADFFRVAGLWRMLIESRGCQMVAAGHISEAGRREALEAFTAWMQRRDAVQTIRETCLVGRRP